MKPFARFLFGQWWVFNSRFEAYARGSAAYAGDTLDEAYRRWARYNTTNRGADHAIQHAC